MSSTNKSGNTRRRRVNRNNSSDNVVSNSSNNIVSNISLSNSLNNNINDMSLSSNSSSNSLSSTVNDTLSSNSSNIIISNISTSMSVSNSLNNVISNNSLDNNINDILLNNNTSNDPSSDPLNDNIDINSSSIPLNTINDNIISNNSLSIPLNNITNEDILAVNILINTNTDAPEFTTDELGMPLHQRDDILLLNSMISFMKDALRISKVTDTLSSDIFNDERLAKFNKNKSNTFGVDKYGLLIRKDDCNNIRSVYGWVKNEANEAINIHIQSELLRMYKSDYEIFDITMRRLRSMFPKDTKQANSQFMRMFKLLYPDNEHVVK